MDDLLRTHANSTMAKWPWTNTEARLRKKHGLKLEQMPGSQAKLIWFISGSNQLTEPRAEKMNQDIKAKRFYLTKIGDSREIGDSSGENLA